MEKQIPTNVPLPLTAVLSVVFICVLFGGNSIAIKIGFEGFGVFFSAFVRFCVATCLLCGWAFATGQSLRIKRRQIPQMAIICICFAVQLPLMNLGLDKTAASRGTLIMNLQPFFVLFLAHFFIPGDTITIRKLSGMIMGFIGVTLVFLEDRGTSSEFRTGDLLVLLSTSMWAMNAVYIKKVIADYKPIVITIYPIVVLLPVSLLASYLWDDRYIGLVDTRIVVAMAFQSVIVASFGYVVWNTMLSRYGATALHSFIFIMPIAGVFFGGLILGELITLKLILALLFVVLGILVTHLRQKKVQPLSTISRNL